MQPLINDGQTMADNVPLWRDWLTTVAALTGENLSDADVRTVLGLTKDVAHNVDRPMAPVTAFLLGVALGKGHNDATLEELAAALTDASHTFPSDDATT